MRWMLTGYCGLALINISVALSNVVWIRCLSIDDTNIEDRGVGFCKINNSSEHWSELQVTRPISFSKRMYRSNMKDGLIILQGLMLAVCISAILFHKRKLMEKKDIIYEEPESDHIYEGLNIETYGGGLYDELSVYHEPEGAEAPWQ